MENCNPINQAGSTSSNFRTSDIKLYDGDILTNITNIVVGTSSLNDLVREIDNVIGTSSNSLSSNVQFNGTLATCITASGDLNDILLAVTNKICADSTTITSIQTTISNLNTVDIVSQGAYSNCVGTYTTSSTLKDLIDGMMAKICSNATDIDSVQGIDFGFGAGLGTTTWGTEGVKDLVYYGGDWSYTTGLTGSIVESNSGYSEYVSSGKYKKVADEVITLQASSDNYVYYNVDSGQYIVTSVAVGSVEPSASGVKLYKLTTDASNVTATQDIRNIYNIDGTRFIDDIILTRHITDGNVTGSKLEDHTTAGSLDLGLGSFSVDVKGRVSSLNNKVNISSLQDNQVLVYDLASDEWVNEDFSSSALPSGTSGDTLRYSSSSWVVSSFVKSFASSLSIASEGITNEALQIGTSGVIAIEAPTPAAPSVSGSLGTSTLSADTYYYAVSYIADDGGESMVSDETSIVIDGIGSNIADISITPIPNATAYRVYKGTVSGTYTEYFIATASGLSYSDDGTAGTAGTPAIGSSAYALRISSTGIGYNYLERPNAPFIFYSDDERVDSFITAGVQGTRTSNLEVIKADATATNTADNIAGSFVATGGANNYTLRLYDGIDNTNKFLKVNDALGSVVFADPTVSIKDENTVLGDFKSFRFIGNGVTAADGGSGEIDITITGSVTELDNMVDVSVASASDYDTLKYNGASWVNDSFLQNTGSRIGIGSPATIDAKLHISAATDTVLKIENTAGAIADIDASGVLTYAEQLKYTYTNSSASPLGVGKVLTSDADGNATWETLPSTGIDNIVEDTTPQLGGTLDANGNFIDMGSNTITDTKVGQWDTAYSWGDHGSAGYLTSFTETNDLTSAVTWANVPNANITESSVTQHEGALSITESQISDLGTYAKVGSYQSGYVSRWNATTNTLDKSIIQDDGTNVGIGTAPVATKKLTVGGSAVIEGSLNVESSSDGKVALVNTVAQDTSGSNYMNWNNSDGTRRGYVGFTSVSTFNINVQQAAEPSKIVLDADEITTGDTNFTWDGTKITVSSSDSDYTEIHNNYIKNVRQGNDSNLLLSTYGTAAVGSEIVSTKYRGTIASHSALINGDLISAHRIIGSIDSVGGVSTCALIEVRAAETFSSTAQGCYYTIDTNAIGETTPTERYKIDENGQHLFTGGVAVDGARVANTTVNINGITEKGLYVKNDNATANHLFDYGIDANADAGAQLGSIGIRGSVGDTVSEGVGSSAMGVLGTAVIEDEVLNPIGGYFHANSIPSAGGSTIRNTIGIMAHPYSGSNVSGGEIIGGVFKQNVAGTPDKVYGIQTVQPIFSGSGGLANNGTYRAIQINPSSIVPSSSHTQYGIYQEGTDDKNYFGGQIQLNHTAGTAGQFLKSTDADGNAEWSAISGYAKVGSYTNGSLTKWNSTTDTLDESILEETSMGLQVSKTYSAATNTSQAFLLSATYGTPTSGNEFSTLKTIALPTAAMGSGTTTSAISSSVGGFYTVGEEVINSYRGYVKVNYDADKVYNISARQIALAAGVSANQSAQIYIGDTDLGSGATVTNQYGILQEGTDQNKFSGEIYTTKNIKLDGQIYNNSGMHNAGSGSSASFDMDDGNVQEWTMTSATTGVANPTNAKDGAVYAICFVQDGTGSRNVNAWGNQFNWGDAGVPDFSTGGANKKHYVTLIRNGSIFDAIYSGIIH